MLCWLYTLAECVWWDSRARVTWDETVRVRLFTLLLWTLNSQGAREKQWRKYESENRQPTWMKTNWLIILQHNIYNQRATLKQTEWAMTNMLVLTTAFTDYIILVNMWLFMKGNICKIFSGRFTGNRNFRFFLWKLHTFPNVLRPADAFFQTPENIWECGLKKNYQK